MIIFDNSYFDVHFSIINAIAVVTHESDNKYPSWKQAKLKVVEVFWEKCKENTSVMGSSL